MRCALYARVSTTDQNPENQLAELRRYVAARGWTTPVEYVDQGVSGAKDRRPALDRMMTDARRRRIDVVVCWRLDRLGRNLKHLITLLEEVQALGVAFVSLAEGIDATTPAGKLQMHILGAIADYAESAITLSFRVVLKQNRHVDLSHRMAAGSSAHRIITPSSSRRRRHAGRLSEFARHAATTPRGCGR
jgi:hypothetical protein